MLEQAAGDEVQRLAVVGQELTAPVFLVDQHLLGLGVDEAGNVLGVLLGLQHVIAQEHGSPASEGHGPDLVRHAPFPHHAAGQAGCLLQVVASAG